MSRALRVSWTAAALLCLAAAARAQIPSQSPAEPLQPENFEQTGKQTINKDEPAAVAQAVELAFGTTVWADVKISTMGPVVDLSRLYHDGFYKLELIQLVLMSAQANQTLAQTVAKRRKGERLSNIAFDYDLDYDALYEQALAVQDFVDELYLPRFPEKRLRKHALEEPNSDMPYYMLP